MIDQPRPDFEPDVMLPPAEEVAASEPEPELDIDGFDPAINKDVEGLMYLGHLEHKCRVLGHEFVLQSLTIGEELIVAKIVEEYQGTHLAGRAYATGLVAASIVLVDGHPLMDQLGPDEELTIRRRFDFINEKWFWTTVNAIYSEYMVLQDRVGKAYEAVLGK